MRKYIGDGVYILPVSPSSMWPDAPEVVAYIVGFQRKEGDCEGIVPIWKSPDDEKYNRPVWNVIQQEPLTLTPSIQCPYHLEEHGYITDGRWVKA